MPYESVIVLPWKYIIMQFWSHGEGFRVAIVLFIWTLSYKTRVTVRKKLAQVYYGAA